MGSFSLQGKQTNEPVPFDMRVSPVFVMNLRALMAGIYAIIINQGGTRSGKTYSILQVIVYYCLLNPNGNKIIDIVRKTKAELYDTVIKDFVDIMQELGLYNEKDHNKTRQTYQLNGNTIRFLGLDKAQKKRGAKRHLLYINECNGITLEDWIQLTIRLEEQAFLDFNPSEYFWLNEEVLEKRDDYAFIKSTYLDNYDFLPPKQIREIENLINIDDFYYKVYVLGILAVMKGKIYTKVNFISEEEYDAIDYDEIFYGIDWGYEHAMVLIEVKYAQEHVYEKELYFESFKYDHDLIEFMLEIGVSMSADVYYDPAYPASGKKLRDAGFNARKAKKDVKDGIRFCQGLKTSICKTSTNYIKQINKYKWKQNADGKIFEGEPVKLDDDAPDASRYAKYSHLKRLIGSN